MTRRVLRDEEKCNLPCEPRSRESIEESRMCDRRRIISANHVKHEVERGENEDAPNAGDPEHNLRKSHGCPELLLRENSIAGAMMKPILFAPFGYNRKHD